MNSIEIVYINETALSSSFHSPTVVKHLDVNWFCHSNIYDNNILIFPNIVNYIFFFIKFISKQSLSQINIHSIYCVHTYGHGHGQTDKSNIPILWCDIICYCINDNITAQLFIVQFQFVVPNNRRKMFVD